MAYLRLKKALLNDKSICASNQKLFKQFLEKQEYKLKRINSLDKLDSGCLKTLIKYIGMLKNVNSWFKNESLTKITKQDIEKVYNDLEDGIIKTKNGQKFKDRKSYYNKIMKSTLFKLAGKAEIAKEVLEFSHQTEHKEVRFIREEDVRKMIDVILQPKQRCLVWLAFDIGENINSLLQLRKKDCVKQKNHVNKEPEYLIRLKKDILKRSRISRSEITNYPDTVTYLDMILKDKQEDDLLFDFRYRMAVKFFARATSLTGVKCFPNDETPTWKDLRSGMACDLLKKEWTTDEVNGRLGHKLSSREIDKYVNILALDRRKPKKRVHQHKLVELKEEINEMKEREKLNAKRIVELENTNEETLQRLKSVKERTREYYVLIAKMAQQIELFHRKLPLIDKKLLAITKKTTRKNKFK